MDSIFRFRVLDSNAVSCIHLDLGHYKNSFFLNSYYKLRGSDFREVCSTNVDFFTLSGSFVSHWTLLSHSWSIKFVCVY